MTGQVQLTAIRGGLMDQADRRKAMAREHPEVQWDGHVGRYHLAYVPMPHGGYTAGGESLEELLDKLEEFFQGLDEPEEVTDSPPGGGGNPRKGLPPGGGKPGDPGG